MTRQHRVSRGVVMVVTAGLAAWLVAAPAGAEPRAEPAWGACPEDVVTGGQALECATVPVPLDYAEPDGTTIDLTVSRLASTDPARRRGVLLLNPGGPGGSLGRTPGEVKKTYFRLAEQLDAAPMNGIDGRLFRLVTFAGLYSEVKYGLTAQIWQSVARDDEAAAQRLAKELLAEETPAVADNAWTVFLAVTCNDVDWPEDVGTYRRAVAADRERYPMYGAAAANITPCAFWSHEPAEPPVAIDDEGPENVLVLQNLRDPATPLRGAELLDEKFGPRSRLVTVDGSGHGAYVFGTNPCALNVTTNYLVDGDLPAADTFCRAGRR